MEKAIPQQHDLSNMSSFITGTQLDSLSIQKVWEGKNRSCKVSTPPDTTPGNGFQCITDSTDDNANTGNAILKDVKQHPIFVYVDTSLPDVH